MAFYSSNYPGFPQLSQKTIYLVDGKKFGTLEEACAFQKKKIDKQLAKIFKDYKVQHGITNKGIYIVYPSTKVEGYQKVEGFAILDGMLVASLQVMPAHWTGTRIFKTTAFWDNYISWSGPVDEIITSLQRARKKLHTTFSGSSGCHVWGWDPKAVHLTLYFMPDLLKCDRIITAE